jgi:hypothetical protein
VHLSLSVSAGPRDHGHTTKHVNWDCCRGRRGSGVDLCYGVVKASAEFLWPVREYKSEESATAPGLASGDWINSEPLKLNNLRGRVVLIEFWTFGCYNCRNTLPYVKRLG